MLSSRTFTTSKCGRSAKETEAACATMFAISAVSSFLVDQKYRSTLAKKYQSVLC